MYILQYASSKGKKIMININDLEETAEFLRMHANYAATQGSMISYYRLINVADFLDDQVRKMKEAMGHASL